MMVQITVQDSPNPAARRFLLDRAVQEAERGRSHVAGDQPDDPLTAAILSQAGVVAVLTLPSSVTVTKSVDINWDDLTDRVRGVIQEHYS